MRQPIVAGNWKLNGTRASTRELVGGVVAGLGSVTDAVEVVVCPTYLHLVDAAALLEGGRVALGAQDASDQASGAYTGEVAATMLAEYGCRYVILGHSERRHVYGESDELINAKVKLALSHGMEVVLCIGETLEEREAGKVNDVCFGQLEGGLAGGIHIDQIPFVPLAVDGNPDGLLSAYVEQLRYASRQMGCIYEPDGRPIVLASDIGDGDDVLLIGRSIRDTVGLDVQVHADRAALLAAFDLHEPGVLLEDDLDIVENDCERHERKRRDAEVLHLNLVVSYFAFANRLTLGLGLELEPEEHPLGEEELMASKRSLAKLDRQ